MKFLKSRKRDVILLSILLLLVLACALPSLIRRIRRSVFSSEGTAALSVVVQDAEGEILRVPLSVDAKYRIMDGVAEAVEADFTLKDWEREKEKEKETEGGDYEEDGGREDSGNRGDPSAGHAINILEIKDGEARITEANCSNQVCVHSLPLTEASHDIPIVCLPHGLVILLEEE